MGRLAKMLCLWGIPCAVVMAGGWMPWYGAVAYGLIGAWLWHKVYCMEERP